MEPIINQQMPEPATKNKTWLWIVVIILVAGLVGAGVYYWQNMEAKKMATSAEEKVRSEMQVKITEAESQANDLANKLSAVEAKLSELEKIQLSSNLCTAAPIPNEVGYYTYPIDEKYKNLRHLGELFTAADCNSPERISGVFGVKGEDYTIGANIGLYNGPSTAMLSTLKNIGFQCKIKTTETDCKQWELKNTVKLNNFLQLKNFYQEIIGSDCINCG